MVSGICFGPALLSVRTGWRTFGHNFARGMPDCTAKHGPLPGCPVTEEVEKRTWPRMSPVLPTIGFGMVSAGRGSPPAVLGKLHADCP